MNAPLIELDLTRLDPTRDTAPDPASPVAEALLARVLATPRTPVDAPGTRTTTATGRRSARLRRWWVLVGAAAAVTAAGLVASQVVSTQGTPQAFASWTAEPAPLTAEQAAAAEADCLATLTAVTGTSGPQVAALSEARGGVVLSLVVTEDETQTCMVLPDEPGQEVESSATGGATADFPVPPADGTSVIWGGYLTTPAGTWSSVTGRAGADVTSVLLTDADGRRVLATLGDGWFTAWWPSRPGRQLTVRTTLADGRTTERVVHHGEH